MIRVAWLGYSFLGRQASGTAQVSRKILSFLLNEKSNEVQITILLKDSHEKKLLAEDSQFSKCSWELLPNVKGRFLRSSRQYYKYCYQKRDKTYDLLHFSVPRLYPFFWLFPAKKFVCIFHAGGEISVPPDKFILSRHVYNILMKIQWKKLNAIYAVSEFGRQEICTYYRIPISRITVITPGVDNLWGLPEKPVNDLDSVKDSILIIGRWQKYKNVHTVLDSIRTSTNEVLANTPIILLGKSNLLGKNLVKKSVDSFISGGRKLSILEYVEDAQLKYLFSNVKLVIHPSLNEGFGIPAFEAFSEGAILLVHKGTPASQYLSRQDGLMTCNMLDAQDIQNSILSCLAKPRGNKMQRVESLKELGMTWWDFGSKVYKSYVKILLPTH